MKEPNFKDFQRFIGEALLNKQPDEKFQPLKSFLTIADTTIEDSIEQMEKTAKRQPKETITRWLEQNKRQELEYYRRAERCRKLIAIYQRTLQSK